MNHLDLVKKVIGDFESIGISITSFDNIIIPGFYPDACGEFNGRSITVECKEVTSANIREQILSAINQYRRGIEYIGPNGIVILAVLKDNNQPVMYYNLTSLVHSEKTNVKAELDRLLKESGELLLSWFNDGTDKLINMDLIAQKKSEQKSKKQTRFFQYLLLMLAIISVIIFIILDGTGSYKLSTERLIIIGMLILLFILPFVKRITFKDGSVEFKEAKDIEDNKR